MQPLSTLPSATGFLLSSLQYRRNDDVLFSDITTFIVDKVLNSGPPGEMYKIQDFEPAQDIFSEGSPTEGDE